MTFHRDTIIGIIVLLVLLIGIVWYAAGHPMQPATPEAGGTNPAAVTGTAKGPQHLAGEGEFYTYDTQYPGSTVLAETAGADADAAAVLLMKGFEQEQIQEFSKSFQDFPADYQESLKSENRKGSLTMEYKTYQTDSTVSYAYTIFMDTLGAHPNGFYRTFVFNTQTGAGLTLSDLFAPGTDYLGQLSRISRDRLPAMIAARENVPVDQVNTDYIDSGTTPDEDNFQNFYLHDGDLAILFPPYQIGPYVLGSTELDISLDDLTGLKEEYR